MSKKEQRPEALQANSRLEKGARSTKGMLVEGAPVALLPGKDRGRQEGLKVRIKREPEKGRRETAQGSSACSERLSIV